MDALSDVLRVIRLTGAVFFTARLSSPWSIASPPPEHLARMLHVQSGCIALFHVVVEGRCWLVMEDGTSVEAGEGTVIIFPHGDAHIMASQPKVEPRPIASLLSGLGGGEVPVLDHGGGGDVARFICGYLQCDQRFNPLIGALPTLLVVERHSGHVRTADEADVEGARDGGDEGGNAWLESTLHHVVEEAKAQRPGTSAMLARLTELLYLEVLRRYMRQLPEGHTGWLAGVNHPEIGRALRLLHAHPERRWTVDDLARAVGLSRSTLAQRFTDLIGQAPLHYLAGWRMQLAQHFLRQSGLGIAQVAARVGYESDVAFHRAFKRHVGVSPATWRNRAE